MGKIDELADHYAEQVTAPWMPNLPGAQRVMLLVYDKDAERMLRARIGEFESRTTSAGHTWTLVDMTTWFAEWMTTIDYGESYFASPELLEMKLEGDFKKHAADRLEAIIAETDENAMVAVMGAASMYGFLRISELIRDVEQAIPGRLLVFFPGSKDGSNYRLLDARDGWNYLANGITLNGGRTNP
ncbi:DUF1788 domain-containing protein [bacterium]|jgi:hypothetical protein|nr:DUF1788 domain-containing protein [bacterium]